MKVLHAFIIILSLSACKTDEKVHNVILYGNKTPYPEVLTATLKLDNTDYKCISFDGGNDNIMFLCSNK